LEVNWHPLLEPLDFRKLVQDAADSLRIRFPEASFQLNIPEHLPPVQADRMGLCAIVQNLLENALKYSQEGTPVTVSAEQSNGMFRFRVADLGQGIPDDEKQSVFEKFYRMGNEETRHSTGTGLGLYIVKQVLKAHQGQVKLSDNQPQGTVFEVELPLR
jgi:signal transduction histidine kinase